MQEVAAYLTAITVMLITVLLVLLQLSFALLNHYFKLSVVYVHLLSIRPHWGGRSTAQRALWTRDSEFCPLK